MKLTVIFISTLLLFDTICCGQTRTILGRVISQDLEPVPAVLMQNIETMLLGKTDLNGRFKIDVPQQTQTLILTMIGFEQTNIKLKNDCDTLEIIMLYASTYDFMSPQKIDRLRLKQFNKLNQLHLLAYEKGLFSKATPCYSNEFESNKPYYDEVKRKIIKKEAEFKQMFNKVNLGDTVKIPLNEQPSHNGTEPAILFPYSAFTDYSNYDCIIKGVVVGKNKKHGGYNLVYKVINCDKCRTESIYKNKTMKPTEVFEHNMRKFKLFIG